MAGIVPTVGRVVLCYGVSKFEPLPGLIVHAFGGTPESCINVVAQGDGHNEPLQTPMMSVRIYDPDAVPMDHASMYCTWMPYQKGQAQKTEQVQALTESRIRTLAQETIGECTEWLRGQIGVSEDRMRELITEALISRGLIPSTAQ